MKVNNSPRSNEIFVEALSKLANGTISDSELAGLSQILGGGKIERNEIDKILKNYIEAIKAENLPTKQFFQAVQQQVQKVNPSVTVSESMVETNQKSGRETIIKGITE